MKKNDYVYHNKYGVGKITTISPGYIYVNFDGENKIFQVKDAHKHLQNITDNQFVIIHGELKKYIGTGSIVQIPVNVSRIGETAFSGNQTITSIDFNNAVFAIGDRAFENCPKLITILNTDGLIRVGANAFHDCIRLNKIDLPSSVQLIEKNAFSGCRSLREVHIPLGVKYIPCSAFRGCSALEKITGLTNVASIHDSAFSGCTKLYIDLPDGLEHIDNRAFYNCDNLTPLIIPSSVSVIADDAFANNDKSVIIYGTPGSYAETYARKHRYPFYNKTVIQKTTTANIHTTSTKETTEQVSSTQTNDVPTLASTIPAIKTSKKQENITSITPVNASGKSVSEAKNTTSAVSVSDKAVQPTNVPTKETTISVKDTAHISSATKQSSAHQKTVTPPEKRLSYNPPEIVDKQVTSYEPKKKTKKRRAGLWAAILTVLILLGTGYGIYHDRVNNIAQLLISGEVQVNSGIYTGEMDWGIIHGTGSMRFPDGSIYEGTFDTGAFSGIGTFTWANSSTYEGEWSNDQMNGSGHLLYSDGSQYDGDFLHGQRSGYGTYQWPNGDIYQGEWLNDLPNGTGSIEQVSGTSYNGIFANGKFIEGTYTVQKTDYSTSIIFAPHKDATFAIEFNDGTQVSGTAYTNDHEIKVSYSNGDTYVGTLVNGVRNGYGVFQWETGESYDGEWLNDEMTGKGTFYFANGSYLSGIFSANTFVSGTANIKSGSTLFKIDITDSVLSDNISVTLSDGAHYSGTYSNNALTGTGTITYADGDKYVGSIQSGLLHGKGIYTWSDGEKYDGNWISGKMDGIGTYYFGTTERLVGSFKDNEPYATCYYYTSDGIRYTTYWTSNGMQYIEQG